MNCPVCNRNLPSTLSICPSCGAMMNDTVREELMDKISPIAKSPETTLRREPVMPPAPLPFVMPGAPKAPPVAAPVQAAPPVRFDTAEISAKPTSPTLVDFQNKNAALPDWRLELQNAVRRRRESTATAAAPARETVNAVSQTVLATNGSAAVKAEVVAYEQPAPVVNDKLEGALKRIEESRRRFLNGDPTPVPVTKAEAPIPAATPAAPTKNYPLYIATKNAQVLPKPAEIKPPAAYSPRPVIEDLPIIEKKELDTNKLRPLPNSSIISTSLEKAPLTVIDEDIEDTKAPMISISRASDDLDDFDEYETELADDEEFEEVEDVAPLAMRFNAAVLDLILGAFASLILLAPLMISGGRWISLAGALAFAVTCTIVMFIYLTTAIGFFGQTLGMKLFSLEVLDVEEEDYPTLHQAAVNSSVYLASLAVGGLGLIPALFNDERRAAHDLLSGTIVVREEY